MTDKKADIQIRPNEISLDQHGKVVISNPTFATMLSQQLERMPPGEETEAGFIQINIIC